MFRVILNNRGIKKYFTHLVYGDVFIDHFLVSMEGNTKTTCFCLPSKSFLDCLMIMNVGVFHDAE